MASSALRRVVRQRNRDQEVTNLNESDLHVQLPSAAHAPVASLLRESTKSDSPEPTHLQIPNSQGIVSMCSVPKFSRLFLGMQEGDIVPVSTKRWRMRSSVGLHKGRIYSLIFVPPCWLWSACDEGQISVCRITRKALVPEHTMTAHEGKMIKSLLWSPSSPNAQVESLSKSGASKVFGGATTDGETVSASMGDQPLGMYYASLPSRDDDQDVLTEMIVSEAAEVDTDEDAGDRTENFLDEDDDQTLSTTPRSSVSSGALSRRRPTLAEDSPRSTSSSSSSSSSSAATTTAATATATATDVIWSASPEHSSVCVWDARTCALQLTVSVQQPVAMLAVGNTVWIGCFQRIVVYNRLNYTPIWLLVNAHSMLVNDIVYAAAADQVWSCASDGLIKCWDPHSFHLLATITTWMPIDHKILAMLPVGDALWSCGFGEQFLVFDMHTRLLAQEFPSHHSDSVRTLQLISSSAHGHVVCSGGRDSRLNIWQVRTRADDSEEPAAAALARVDEYRQLIADGADVTHVELPNLLLRMHHLTALAKVISPAVPVVVLDLSHNKLGNKGASLVAELLSSMPALQALNVENNGITGVGMRSLRRALNGNTTVIHLSVGELHFDAESSRCIADMRGIVDANRSLVAVAKSPTASTLTAGPRSLPGFPKRLLLADYALQITTLDISHNRIRSLPRDARMYQQLRHLNVSHNAFRQLPSLYLFPNIESVDCSHNSIAVIPPHVVFSHQLTRLNVADNQLRNLPFLLGIMPWLDVHIAGNPVASRPTGAGGTYGSLGADLTPFLRCLQGIPIGLRMARVTFVGSAGSGKSAAIRRLCDCDNAAAAAARHAPDKSSSRTAISSSYWLSSLCPNTSWHVLELAATAPSPLLPALLQRCGVYVVTFELRSANSDTHLRNWLRCIAAVAPDCAVVLLATHTADCPPDRTAELLQSIWDTHATANANVRLVVSLAESPTAATAGNTAAAGSNAAAAAAAADADEWQHAVDVASRPVQVGVKPSTLLRVLAALCEVHEPLTAESALYPHRFLSLSEILSAYASMHRNVLCYDDINELFDICHILPAERPAALRFLRYSGYAELFDLAHPSGQFQSELTSSTLIVQRHWLLSVLDRLAVVPAELVRKSPIHIPEVNIWDVWKQELRDPELVPVLRWLLVALQIGVAGSTDTAVCLPSLLRSEAPDSSRIAEWWTQEAVPTTPLHSTIGDDANSTTDCFRFFDFEVAPPHFFLLLMCHLLGSGPDFEVLTLWQHGIFLETRGGNELSLSGGDKEPPKQAEASAALLASVAKQSLPRIRPASVMPRRPTLSSASPTSSAGSGGSGASSASSSSKANQRSTSSSLGNSLCSSVVRNRSLLAKGIKISLVFDPDRRRLSLALRGPVLLVSDVFLFMTTAINTFLASNTNLKGNALIPCPPCCRGICQRQPALFRQMTFVPLEFSIAVDSWSPSVLTAPSRSMSSLFRKSKSSTSKSGIKRRSKRAKSSTADGVTASPSSSSELSSPSSSSGVPTWSVEELLERLGNDQVYIECRSCGSATRIDLIAPDMAFSASGLTFAAGDIEVVRELGRGSSAVVQLANYKGEQVAVKVLRARNHDRSESSGSSFSLSAHARFRQEAWMMNLYRHPNLVPIRAVCLQPPMLMLPFMELGDLYHYIHDASNALPEPLAAALLLDITRAMLYLSSCMPPVCHRDLRPSNVFLRRSATLGRVQAVVGDLGLSCALVFAKSHVDSSEELGNVIYSAPEVLAGRVYSIRSDIWAWGITAWELLTRRKPFADCKWMWEVERKVVAGNTPLDDAVPLPPLMQALLVGALKTSPDERVTFKEIYDKLSKDEKSQ